MATTTKSQTRTRKATPAGRTSRSTASRAAAKAGTTTRKQKTAEAKPAPVAAVVVNDPPAPVAMTASPEKFRRPDLINAVANRTSLKRADAKLVLELVLDELGKALDAQDELALQPLGTLSVKKRKAVGNGDMLTIKLKRRAPNGGLTPLAEPETES